jgi:hypothetical protein
MTTTSPLTREIATFDRERERLEREHVGKFVLIRGDEVIGTYDAFQTAADEGLRRFGNTPFLIREIGRRDYTLSPAIMYGLTIAARQDQLRKSE